jgi:DNA-binding NtrC family response regulator
MSLEGESPYRPRVGTEGNLSERFWTGLRELQEQLLRNAAKPSYLDDVVDVLASALGADRVLLFLGEPSAGGHVVAGRHCSRRALSPVEQVEIASAVIDGAIGAARCVLWKPDRSSRESTLALGIWSVLASPLQTSIAENGNSVALRGVLYADFRDPTADISELHRQFFESASLLIAGMLEQRERVEGAEQEARRAREIQPDDHEIEGPSLEELMRPKSMSEFRKDVRAAVLGGSHVIILGESGTGKTRLAELIAQASGRTPIVRATLGQSDDLNTITSELFGHERGAFSGAASKRVGLVEHANAGTIILDEILNLPPHAQQLLLDFTQFGTYRPLGYQGQQPKRAKVRIIAATNGDLAAAMRDGRFRRDLWFRLSAVPIRLPSLRERREDIPMLAEAYLRRLDPGRPWRLSIPAKRLLVSSELTWEGNIRELEGVLQRARDRALAENRENILLRDEHIRARDLGREHIDVPEPGTYVPTPVVKEFQVEADELDDSWARLQRERQALDEVETRIIGMALQRHHGTVAHAAKELNVSRTSLLSRIQTLGIDYKVFKK